MTLVPRLQNKAIECGRMFAPPEAILASPVVGGNLIDGWWVGSENPAFNYFFKVDNKNTRISCEICSKLTIKTTERRH